MIKLIIQEIRYQYRLALLLMLYALGIILFTEFNNIWQGNADFDKLGLMFFIGSAFMIQTKNEKKYAMLATIPQNLYKAAILRFIAPFIFSLIYYLSFIAVFLLIGAKLNSKILEDYALSIFLFYFFYGTAFFAKDLSFIFKIKALGMSLGIIAPIILAICVPLFSYFVLDLNFFETFIYFSIVLNAVINISSIFTFMKRKSYI